MYWEIGLKINGEAGQVTVHPTALQEPRAGNAIEHVYDMAQALHPDTLVEFLYCKEYETQEGGHC